jgi:hypothetical protein
MMDTKPVTEVVARFRCERCGFRALFVGPAVKVYPAHTDMMIEHLRESP